MLPREINIAHPIGWDGYVYHGTKTMTIKEDCPLCGKKLEIWYSRYYDGTSFDQITGCEGACNANDIYKKLELPK